MDRARIEEEIRQVAYEIYVKSGCIEGRDLDNWLEAKRIVYERYGLTEDPESPIEEQVETKRRRRRTCKTESTDKSETEKKTRKGTKTKGSTKGSRKK